MNQLKTIPNSTRIKIKDRQGEIVEFFELRMLKFNENGIEIAISGRLSEEELVRIAESMI